MVQAPRNPNYAATVVALKDFVELAGCDNVKSALIFGNSVIVAKNAQAGDVGLFFPAETQLAKDFLANNNLYRKPEFGNVNPNNTGFFEQSGRVKTMKFRGHKSEGFWIPMSSLTYLSVGVWGGYVTGDTFDFIGEHEICRKYFPRGYRPGAAATKAKTAKLADSIVDGQFRFHFDTENLRRNIHKIKPTNFISLSDKWHGTSVVIGKILVKRKLNFVERLLKRLGVAVNDQTYGLTYSSRKVIKAVNGVEKHSNHYYSEDIWGVVAREVADRVPNGFTIYGEIVGFTTDGSPIQAGYRYGCGPNEHKLLIYRVTATTFDGKVLELSWKQMFEFCAKYGFEAVRELYYGEAGDLFAHLPSGAEDWNEWFLKELEASYVNDGPCPFNNPEVPAEGIVLRVDCLEECQSYKLKNFRFLERETKLLDKGEVDTETSQSDEAEELEAA